MRNAIDGNDFQYVVFGWLNPFPKRKLIPFSTLNDELRNVGIPLTLTELNAYRNKEEIKKTNSYADVMLSTVVYSQSNFESECIGPFVVDIDGDSLKDSLECSVNVTEYLCKAYKLSPFDIRFSFSGHRSIHQILPSELYLTRSYPEHKLRVAQRKLALRIKEEMGAPVCMDMYNLKSMLRVVGTKNSKGGYFKIRLLPDEVKPSYTDNILALAENPRFSVEWNVQVRPNSTFCSLLGDDFKKLVGEGANTPNKYPLSSFETKIENEIERGLDIIRDNEKISRIYFMGDTSDFRHTNFSDPTAPAEESIVYNLVQGGVVSYEAIDKIMVNSATEKWQKRDSNYRKSTYNKALQFVITKIKQTPAPVSMRKLNSYWPNPAPVNSYKLFHSPKQGITIVRLEGLPVPSDTNPRKLLWEVVFYRVGHNVKLNVKGGRKGILEAYKGLSNEIQRAKPTSFALPIYAVIWRYGDERFPKYAVEYFKDEKEIEEFWYLTEKDIIQKIPKFRQRWLVLEQYRGYRGGD